MISDDTIRSIRKKYEAINADLNERSRRHWAASEAMVLGHGGIVAVSKATGIAISTIRIGLHELKSPNNISSKRIRKAGGGRKKIIERNPNIIAALESVVEPTAKGDPESPLKWTFKSTRKIAEELSKSFKVSHAKIADLLHEAGYSLQANKKSVEGISHPDRNAQFEHINKKAKEFLGKKQPVISVDTKKRELVGNFKNNGQEWMPKGMPENVNVHDFETELGKVTPYGVYDIANNNGWVSVGIDNDTAAFAVESIRSWWRSMGAAEYPDAGNILINADCGGSNGYRNRLWKLELQKFADETRLTVTVCHYPPGTSKWNKIEHKLFSFISMNWRGKPLISYAVVVSLIANTTTTKGLTVKCRLDKSKYPKGIKISDDMMEKLNIQYDEFHGDWNYTIKPRK